MCSVRNPQTAFDFRQTRTSAKVQWDEIDDVLDANPQIPAWIWQN